MVVKASAPHAEARGQAGKGDSEEEEPESHSDLSGAEEGEDPVKLLQPVNTASQEVDEEFERDLAALTINRPTAAPTAATSEQQVILCPAANGELKVFAI